MPQVSVLTPTYNQELYIEACIRSVQAQTFEDWEMIIVDDGSTDSTVERARAIDDNRIRIVQLEHRGLSHLGETYNRGLAEASAPYVAILEGDDLWEPDKLASQIPAFTDPEVILVASGFQEISSEGDVLDVITASGNAAAERNDPIGSASLWMMRPQKLTFVFPVTLLIRRAALDRMGGFQQPPYLDVVDLPTLLNLGLEGKWVYVHRVLATWRRHPDSATSTRLPRILSGAYQYVSEFVSNNRDRLPATDGELDNIALMWEYFEAGRAQALSVLLARNRDFVSAREAALRGRLFRLRSRTRLALEIGAILTQMRVDPEIGYRILGKGGLLERMRLPGGETMVESAMNPAEIVRRDFAPRKRRRLSHNR
jgi:glycosyltransferase involved in cell wall biosynthesis